MGCPQLSLCKSLPHSFAQQICTRLPVCARNEPDARLRAGSMQTSNKEVEGNNEAVNLCSRQTQEAGPLCPLSRRKHSGKLTAFSSSGPRTHLPLQAAGGRGTAKGGAWPPLWYTCEDTGQRAFVLRLLDLLLTSPSPDGQELPAGRTTGMKSQRK